MRKFFSFPLQSLLSPFLFAIYPIIFLYATNIKKVLISEVLLPIILASLLCLITFVITRLIIKNVYKTSIFTTLFLILFLNYGHFFDFLRTTPLDKYLKGKQTVVLLLCAFIFLISSYALLKSKRSLLRLTKILNIVSIILVLIPSFIIISFYIKTSSIKLPVSTISSKKKFDIDSVQIRENLPDVYYIILDRYASKNILQKVYNFDNSEFQTPLKQKGFFIASESLANYATTGQSLASSLNMTHLNHLSFLGDQQYSDWKLINEKVSNNDVLRIFKTLGYNTYHFGSWWAQSRVNKHADININIDTTPGFFYLVFSKTILHPLRVKMGLVPDFPEEQWKREQLKFRKLKEIVFQNRPKFVFAHFLITHTPYTFRADGGFLDENNKQNMSEEEKYLEGLKYSNQQIAELINHLLQNKKDYDPVIIIQSDEGPYPNRVNKDQKNFDWTKANEEEIAIKMEILNAYYLPHGGSKLLYQSISPVNTFRIVFNYYFNQNYQLLSDDSFLSNLNQPYTFIPVEK